jgi:hypothetical protein
VVRNPDRDLWSLIPVPYLAVFPDLIPTAETPHGDTYAGPFFYTTIFDW